MVLANCGFHHPHRYNFKTLNELQFVKIGSRDLASVQGGVGGEVKKRRHGNPAQLRERVVYTRLLLLRRQQNAAAQDEQTEGGQLV